MFYIITIFTLSAVQTVSLNTRVHESSLHEVGQECCQAYSGKLCGRLFTNCCKKGCESGLIGEYCIDGEEITTNCQKLTCLSVCKSKGGKACGVSVSKGSVDCCQERYCRKSTQQTGSLTDSVKSGLLEGVKEKIMNMIFHEDIRNVQAEHEYFVDTVLEKVMGRNSMCEIGRAMELGKCVGDSSLDLLLVRKDE